MKCLFCTRDYNLTTHKHLIYIRVHWSEINDIVLPADGLLSDRLGLPLWSVHPEAEAAGGGARPQPGWGEHPAGADQRQGDPGGAINDRRSEMSLNDTTREQLHVVCVCVCVCFQTLKGLCLDSKRSTILQRLELSLDILGGTVERISNTAEVLGAVHQVHGGSSNLWAYKMIRGMKREKYIHIFFL